MSDYEQLIPLIRWLRNSQKRIDADGMLHAAEAADAVDEWLREHDAKLEAELKAQQDEIE